MTDVALPRSTPGLSRPSFWAQAGLLIALTWLYDASHRFRGHVRAEAVVNGESVLHADRALHAAAEVPLNAWVVGHPAVERAFSAYYFLGHGIATALALLLLWAVWPGSYRRERNALFALSAAGFVVYWLFPVAPPRMLPGFADSVAAHLPFATHVEAGASNEYAAMPSLHMAWAVWVAVALWRPARARWARALLVAHLALTVLVVLGTANHYVLDLVAGAALVGGTYAAVAALARSRPTRPRPAFR